VTDGDRDRAPADPGPGERAAADSVDNSANRADRRRPRSVYAVGSEPDPRFSLANERTALAWVRTGLALIAGGIALTSVAALTGLPAFLDVVALLACLFGGAIAVIALVSWRSVERALRRGDPLPAPRALGWLVSLVVIAAVGVAVYALTQMPR
jgi:putative membrane protein